jgi:hypothetical protein
VPGQVLRRELDHEPTAGLWRFRESLSPAPGTLDAAGRGLEPGRELAALAVVIDGWDDQS